MLQFNIREHEPLKHRYCDWRGKYTVGYNDYRGLRICILPSYANVTNCDDGTRTAVYRGTKIRILQ